MKRNWLLDMLADELRPFAIQVETRPHFYIESADGSDDGSDWCWDCAQAEIAKRGQGDVLSTSGECDTPPSCQCCGAILESALTREGGFYELDHFADNRPEGGDLVAAYDLHRMAEALVYAAEHSGPQALVAAICARFLADTTEPQDRWADDGGLTP